MRPASRRLLDAHAFPARFFDQLEILLIEPLNLIRDLPRLREDFRILDRRFVVDRVGVDELPPLDDPKRIAVEGAVRVDPWLLVVADRIEAEVRRLDDKRIAFPTPA